MATITDAPAALLTYEAYMAEPEVHGRYDIINGVRSVMPGTTWRHQRTAKNLAQILIAYEESKEGGLTVFAPFDVLIRRAPKLQTRQPDMLFISHARLAQGVGVPEVGSLETAPELVVEIVSNSETQRIVGDKIADYCAIGVEECWLVRPETQTLEVLRLSASGSQSIGLYDSTESFTSCAFPDLTAAVADCFVL